MPIAISRAVRDALVAEAAAALNVEVCGLLLGDGARITSFVPAPNVSPSPADSFEIDPSVLIGSHKAAREGRLQIIGCYHSHPNGIARPSQRDAESAQKGEMWLVLTSKEARLWRFDGKMFSAETLDASEDVPLT